MIILIIITCIEDACKVGRKTISPDKITPTPTHIDIVKDVENDFNEHNDCRLLCIMHINYLKCFIT